MGGASSRSPTSSQEAGVQPLTTAGASGLPLTRLMGMYIFRNVGPEAMAAVRDGDAKLTDEDYVAGAQALADLADAGVLRRGLLDPRRRHLDEPVPHRHSRDDL